MSDTDKIDEVVSEGLQMFWEHVASEYTDATTGDLSPPIHGMLCSAATVAVADWVEHNVTVTAEIIEA